MNLNARQLTLLIICLIVLGVLLLPFWPYSRWGYFPSGVSFTCVALLWALKTLSRES